MYYTGNIMYTNTIYNIKFEMKSFNICMFVYMLIIRISTYKMDYSTLFSMVWKINYIHTRNVYTRRH